MAHFSAGEGKAAPEIHPGLADELQGVTLEALREVALREGISKEMINDTIGVHLHQKQPKPALIALIMGNRERADSSQQTQPRGTPARPVPPPTDWTTTEEESWEGAGNLTRLIGSEESASG